MKSLQNHSCRVLCANELCRLENRMRITDVKALTETMCFVSSYHFRWLNEVVAPTRLLGEVCIYHFEQNNRDYIYDYQFSHYPAILMYTVNYRACWHILKYYMLH